MARKIVTVADDNTLPTTLKIPANLVKDSVDSAVASNPSLKRDKGDKGDPGTPGTKGDKGDPGTNAAGSNILVLKTGTPVPDNTPVGTIVFFVSGDVTGPSETLTVGTPVFTTATTTATTMNLTMPADTSKGTIAILIAQVSADAWGLPAGWVKVFSGPSNTRGVLVAYAPPGVSANTFTSPNGATRLVGATLPVTGVKGELTGSVRIDSVLNQATQTHTTVNIPALSLPKTSLGFTISTTNMSGTNTTMAGTASATTQVSTSFTNLHIIVKGAVNSIAEESLTIDPGMSTFIPGYHVGVA